MKRPYKLEPFQLTMSVVGLFIIMFIGSSCAAPRVFSSSTEIIDDTGIPMRLVPAGEFTVGSDTDSDTRNLEHRMYLDAFYMDKYEVTNAHYAACVTDGACEPPHFTKSDFRASYYGDPEFDNYPVLYVNWLIARTYCEMWRGARLPTEAEWEKAARGADGREDLTRGGDRVIRGGFWSEDSNDLQVFYRSWFAPEYSESEIGIRCAKSL